MSLEEGGWYPGERVPMCQFPLPGRPPITLHSIREQVQATNCGHPLLFALHTYPQGPWHPTHHVPLSCALQLGNSSCPPVPLQILSPAEENP